MCSDLRVTKYAKEYQLYREFPLLYKHSLALREESTHTHTHTTFVSPRGAADIFLKETQTHNYATRYVKVSYTTLCLQRGLNGCRLCTHWRVEK